MNSFVIRRADGGVSVVTPDPGTPELRAAELAKWESAAPAPWLPVAGTAVVDSATLPDRADRDAWVHSGSAVVVDGARKANLLAAKLVDWRARAKAALQGVVDQSARIDRGIALATMDEINSLRQWITSFKAAVAAATTLADLKTRVAALGNLPDRTPSQVKSAVVAKIDDGSAD